MSVRPITEALIWSPMGGTQVVFYDESTLLTNGADFYGVWVSPAVWKSEQRKDLAELVAVTVGYVSEAPSSFELSGSGDGGETWIQPVDLQPVPTIEHHQGMEFITANFSEVQGYHLAYRICFTEPEIIVVRKTICEFVVRGNVRYRFLDFLAT